MRRIAIMSTVVLCATAWVSLTRAEEAAKPAAAAAAEQPKPEELLRKVADYYADLEAFSCRASITFRIEAPGMNQSTDMKMTIRLERPNRFAMIMDEGPFTVTVMSDGKHVWQYMPMFNRYTEQEAPEDLSALAEGDGPHLMMMPGGMIPTDGQEFYNTLMEGVTSSEYLGEEQVGEATCHRLRFVQEEFTWDIWIETGERPLVHKIVPDLSKQFAEAGEMFKDAKIEYSAVLADWNVSPKFTEADFTFVPPADAEKVESLFEGLAGGQEDEGPHELLGQDAPTFQTTNVEGQPIDLSKHVGKDVIMLDFWATWCGPCVRAMPEVDAVAKKYADRGVVFYAVNVQEDAETIKGFLESSELDVPVAMDPEGRINEMYGVNGIPQTVLVGKDGKVHVVHVGFSPGLGEELAKNIEDLLAGKDLAGPVLAEAKSEEPTAEEEPAESNP